LIFLGGRYQNVISGVTLMLLLHFSCSLKLRSIYRIYKWWAYKIVYSVHNASLTSALDMFLIAKYLYI